MFFLSPKNKSKESKVMLLKRKEIKSEINLNRIIRLKTFNFYLANKSIFTISIAHWKKKRMYICLPKWTPTDVRSISKIEQD